MKGALSRNQSHSVAISRNQSQSAALSRNQSHSVAINRNQRPSLVQIDPALDPQDLHDHAERPETVAAKLRVALDGLPGRVGGVHAARDEDRPAVVIGVDELPD